MRKAQPVRSSLRGQKIRGELLLSKQSQEYKVQESTNCSDHPPTLLLFLQVKEERPKTGLVLSRLDGVLTNVIAGTNIDSIVDGL
jgi:hypothetical protein